MNRSFLKLSVITVSILLTACACACAGSGNVAIPMPIIDPSATDSKENAHSVIEISNKFDNNDYGQSNRQADHLNFKDTYDEGLDGTGVSVDVIDGDFTQSQNDKFETLIGSVTTVKDTANLDGNLSFIGIKNGYIPMDNTTVDVITAKKINGQFTSRDIDSRLLLEGTTKYSENNVQLDINRISAKKAIQNLSLNETDQNVIELGATALDQAFEKLDSYILMNDVNTNTLTFAEGVSKLQNISTNKNLVNSLYSLTGSIYSNNASISSLVQDRLSQDFLSYFDGANEKATAIVQFNHINNKWNPHGLSSKPNTNSGLLGAVKKVNANLTVGAAYNFQKTDLSQGISAHKTDNADIKTNGILIGAKYKPEILKGVAIKSSLGYSDYRNNVNRIIFLDDDYSTDRKVKGDFWQFTLLSEKQFNFNNFILLPQIGIQYDYLQQD